MKTTVQALLLTGLSILAGMVIIEAGLRIFGISYVQAYTYDELRGSALRAGAKGKWTREGESWIEINSDGLRDREHSVEKNENTFRIAVLGDSYAEAFQVERSRTFWSVLENELNRCPRFEGKAVEVINFGVAGYGTAQELLTFRNHVRKYHPDLVLLAMVTGNDIRNNSMALEPDKVRPFFIHQNRKLVPDNSFQDLPQYKKGQSFLKRMLRQAGTHLRVVQLLYEVKQRGVTNLFLNKGGFQKREKTGMPAADQVRKGAAAERGLDVQVYHEPVTPEWQAAWQITEDLILMLGKEVEASGASFLVVTLSNGIQVHPDPDVRAHFMKSQGISNLFYPDERIWEVCRLANIPVLNLAKPFRIYAEQNNECLHGFENSTPCGGHWNEKGHLLAGRLMADEICVSARLLK